LTDHRYAPILELLSNMVLTETQTQSIPIAVVVILRSVWRVIMMH